jgi:hypothetical protein
MINLELIKPSRAGFWLCLLIYLAAFGLPMNLDDRYFPGYSMFAFGALGFVLSLYGLFFGLVRGLPWECLAFFLATLPWLANFFFWCGLALYAQGNGRPSFISALIAVILAAGALVPWNGVWIGRLDLWATIATPAYLAWIGSMGLLVILAGYLAWLQRPGQILWKPDIDLSMQNIEPGVQAESDSTEAIQRF